MATADVDALTEYFATVGFSETRAKETARNKQLGPAVHEICQSNGLSPQQQLTDKQAALVCQLAKDASKLPKPERDYVVHAVVVDAKLKLSDQVAAAIKYLSAHPGLPVDEEAFDKACGVGFSATPEQVTEKVRAWADAAKDELAKTGWAGFGKATGQVKQDDWIKWANGLDVKNALEQVYTDMFGPKQNTSKSALTAAKGKAKESAKQSSDKAESSRAATAAAPEHADDMFATGWLARLHMPGGNEQPNPVRMKEHLAKTNGKVFTRFPPEPNGFLHIGHSKAIAVNFGYARYHHGHCYLRYDDTNPEAEEQIYFDKILEMVRWLGFEPYKITYSSDNFQILYDLAVDLIKRGLAYTSDDSAEEIQAQRGGKDHGPRHDSKDRNKPVDQVLREFEDMKNGKYKPQQMALRMKQDMESPNPCMWDLIAYRVLETPHYRTGTKWCIYPTYDFTHCLCDSFENITHSLCTTEFIAARTSYEWLCDALDVYKPRQSEYGRLNLEGTVMSKRKLLKLVKGGYVSGWDDPRLYTLIALKRRGVPPNAIISFVSGLGVSTQTSVVPLARFEQTVRQHLEMTTPRLSMILRPIKLVIENLSDDHVEWLERPVHPKEPSMGTHKVVFTPTVYIESDDFRTEPSKDFLRLAPGRTIGLLNVPKPITYVSHEVDPSTGSISLIRCRLEDGPSPPKPKAWIHWIASHAPSRSPIAVSETRIFRRLFRSDDPGSLGDAYVSDIDPSSLEVVRTSIVESAFWDTSRASLARAREAAKERREQAERDGTEAPPDVDGLEAIRFQGMRTAYFCVDNVDAVLPDSILNGHNVANENESASKIVLNMIAPLKEDAGKKKA